MITTKAHTLTRADLSRLPVCALEQIALQLAAAVDAEHAPRAPLEAVLRAVAEHL